VTEASVASTASKDIGRPILELTGISKSFGHVQALRDVDFGLVQGEIMALVGDNGAGKSTLIKVISGAHQPDSGTVRYQGKQVHITNPRVARDLGIATVYQDLALVNQRSVAANLFLGREPNKAFVVDTKRMVKEAERVLSELHIRIPSAHALVGVLSGGQRQAVAIGRAMAQGGNVVIMDEPTAALGVEQSHFVVELIQRLKSRGCSILVVSHNLQHVFSVADRITVMRGGRVIAVRTKATTNTDEIVKLIVGADVVQMYPV
jgi:ABC-type sugar transport system ATPase subunit